MVAQAWRVSWILTGSVLLVAMTSGVSRAQCAFDHAAKTRPISVSLVRANAPCDGPFTFPTPNTQTTAGVPACATPTPIDEGDWCLSPSFCSAPAATAYTFGPDGACKVTVNGGVESPCPTSSEVPDCLSLKAKVSCKDLRDGAGELAQSSSTDWSLNTVWRITDVDENGTPLTVIDWPGIIGLSAESGGISDKRELLDVAGIGFSPCAQAELVYMKLFAPDGEIFATPGSAAGVP